MSSEAKSTSAVAPRSSELYIPPPGLAFRILGYASQNVIFSRDHDPSRVGQTPVTETVWGDQWFTLLHGTGEHAGLYAIKGREYGYVLYSRRNEDPRVYHVEGNGKYNDNWFKIEPGQGQYALHFRLITPSEGMAMFSRTNEYPYLYNIESGKIYSDHYFSFIWEDMQVDRVDFDLEAGFIVSSTPITLAGQTLTNNSDVEQEMSFSVDKGVTNTSSFEYSTGFTVTVGMEFSVGIPFISEGKFSIEASSTNTWTWGSSTEYTTQYTASFPVKAGPHQKVHATSMVNQGVLDVPYTMHLSSKSAGVKVQTTGTWRGVSSWDLRHTITPIN
ncbi:hemolytic lectin [Daedaleopsis nitida]|nr:hemolytic lectin [Daedaleopsis nitida]